MDICADSNLLVASANKNSPFYPASRNSISKILSRGDRLIVFPQNLIEFWAVSTRPISANGLGLTISQAVTEVEQIRTIFELLPETPAIYPEWQRLVVAHNVLGKSVHDARIAAQMKVHNIETVLTFNVTDFGRYPGIIAVEPAIV